MSDPKVHPLRKKHRRGRAAGKKRRERMAAKAVVPVVVPSPTAVLSLRKRLSLLANHG